MSDIRILLRKVLSLLQSKRAYLCHFEPRLLRLFDEDVTFIMANMDLFLPLIPLPIPPPGKGPILVLGAHPDDEALGAGGSLIMARDKGTEIAIAFLTNGEPRNGSGAEEKGRIRRTEAGTVAETLNAEVSFFRARDGALALDRNLAQEASGWIKSLLERIKPRAVFCPFPLDAHSDHRLVAWALANALDPGAQKPEIWSYEVASLCPANVLVDITAVEEAKADLIGVYVSQLALYDYINVFRGLNHFHSRNIRGRGAAEAFFRLPALEFRKLVERMSPEQLFKEDAASLT